MNKAILNLEKRKNKVLKMRSNYLFNCDKETENFISRIERFDEIIDRIVKTIKLEWNNTYKK
jgi:hypothetical protein